MIDEKRQRITEQLPTLDLGPDATALLEAEPAAPLDVEGIAALARNPEKATSLYAAFLLVVSPDGHAERDYLSALAERMGLDPTLVRHLHGKAEELA